MNVIIVTDTFPPEKVGSYRMHDLALNLRRDGFGVKVFCPPPTFPFGSFKRTWKPASATTTPQGITVVNLWTWQPQSASLSTLSRIFYYLMMPLFATVMIALDGDFDVVITSSGTTPFLWLPGLVAKKLRRKPWLLDERDLLLEGAVSLGFLKKDRIATSLLQTLDSYCLRTCDFVTVTTQSAKAGVIANGAPKPKVLFIPNAADTDVFYPLTVPKKRQVIYAGNIEYAQDFDCVLSAMEQVASHGLGLVIVGEGEVKEHLQNVVTKSNLGGVVTFLGGVERSKLAPLLSESMAGLAPLKPVAIINGSIPAKIFDYMACAIPFVAFGGLDLKRIVDRSGAGFLIDADPDVLAKTLLYLAENSQVIEEMGRNGREYCEKYYNRRLMAKKIEALLQKMSPDATAAPSAA
ncbi:MAG: glycosyltransferase family 4 protein [Candidatus Bathyarchaeota archaeon]|nr:glycosyltransferase family 4 protein [Candidatus Bathyarchaeota archaeon]